MIHGALNYESQHDTPMDHNFFPNKRWNAYKRWQDTGYIFFDRIAKRFDPMIFRPSHPIVAVLHTSPNGSTAYAPIR